MDKKNDIRVKRKSSNSFSAVKRSLKRIPSFKIKLLLAMNLDFTIMMQKLRSHGNQSKHKEVQICSVLPKRRYLNFLTCEV